MIRLSAQTRILASPERCFDLARSVEAHTLTARLIHGTAVAGRTEGLAGLGDRTTWSARFFGLRFTLTTEITEFDRPYGFSDTMRAGLFSHFGHRYSFEPVSLAQTLMTDDFWFASPGGLFGTVFDALFLRRRMQVVLESRALTLKRMAESEEWRGYLP